MRIWESPRDGSLLGSVQEGVMGVVSSLMSGGREGYSCYVSFLLSIPVDLGSGGPSEGHGTSRQGQTAVYESVVTLCNKTSV